MKLTSTFSCGTIFSLLCKNKKKGCVKWRNPFCVDDEW